MSKSHALDDLVSRFGLSAEEARKFTSRLRSALGGAPAPAAGDDRAIRAARLAEANATLAIEGLALAPEEAAFFAFIDDFALPEAVAESIVRDYSMARARSLIGRAPKMA